MRIPVTYIEKKDINVEITPISLVKYIDEYITNSFNMPYEAFLTKVKDTTYWVRTVYSSHDHDEFIQPATAEEIKIMEALNIVRGYVLSKRELPVCA